MNRVGAEAPARFLCITKENSLSEIIKIAQAVSNSVIMFFAESKSFLSIDFEMEFNNASSYKSVAEINEFV